jgi:hypothetical protein
MSGNPQAGSSLRISYRPKGVVFPVEDLAAWIAEYIGGHEARGIRGMEEMIQDLAARVHAAVGVPVKARAHLEIKPPFGGDPQGMAVICRAGYGSAPWPAASS